jgi:predicted ArsR family transcriptional regulator
LHRGYAPGLDFVKDNLYKVAMPRSTASPQPPPRRTPADPRSRRAILELLKWHGPQDARTLAGRLGVTAMAVRQHLYSLAEEKLVTSEEEARAMGRPAKLWRLTPAADELFPNAHADLTLSLIQSMRQTFGERGLDRLIAVRTRGQIETYRSQMAQMAQAPRTARAAQAPEAGSLRARLAALAALRSREGYMAEVQEEAVKEGEEKEGEKKEGALLLVENHCPICVAATACTNLCAGELRVFQEVLGGGVRVERVDHILAGARRCAYRVTAVAAGKGGSVGNGVSAAASETAVAPDSAGAPEPAVTAAPLPRRASRRRS